MSGGSLLAIKSTGRKRKTKMLQMNSVASGPEAATLTKRSERNISGRVKLLRKVKAESECMV